MTLQNFPIVGLTKGYQTNVKPAMLPDQAWQLLENAYVFRERILKREGRQLLGRLQRNLTGQSLGLTNVGVTSQTFANIFTTLSITEPQAEIKAGTLVITIAAPDTASFTDNGDGTFAVTGNGKALGSYVDYVTGKVVLQFNVATVGGAAITAAFNYFPTLPVMGIYQREIPTINDEQTIWFDTKYAYQWAGTEFAEFIPGTTWSGTDADFFTAYNYRGANASDRLFFVTNDVVNASNPIRYTDGTTWTNFEPIISANIVENQNLGNVVAPWLTFSGVLSAPVVKGSVNITVGGVEFTDVLQDGTLTGLPNTNSGIINYATGAFTINFNPALTVDTAVKASYSWGSLTSLTQARIFIAYYGRLLALNTWEGVDYATSKNFFNRCRFCQLGSPIDAQAWRTDVFGRGGFIDAPVNEQIVSATFIKNTLIVDFERSTWQLRYVGEYGLPFIWERVSADFGSESTFSAVLFDNHRLVIGDKAITKGNSLGVDRLDLEIPDQIFEFSNINDNVGRVWGIRDYKKELVYWCFPAVNTEAAFDIGIKFPNYVLVYNYRNNTWSIFRDNITCFGTFQSPTGLTWDSLSTFWDETDVFWDNSGDQPLFPLIVCGDQQGFISTYGYDSPSNASTVASNEQETLTIQSIDLTTTPITITSVNHNLQQGDIIYISGMEFLDQTANFVPLPTNLNNNLYQVQWVSTPPSADKFTILKWNTVTQQYENNFSFTPDPAKALYVGNGKITLMPKLNILSKDINIFQGKSLQTKLSRLDFLFEPQDAGAVTINLWLNASTDGQTPGVVQGNKLVGDKNLSIFADPAFYTPGSQYQWFRFYATLAAQYFSINITYNDDLMNTFATHSQDATLYAINAWCRPGGKNVF